MTPPAGVAVDVLVPTYRRPDALAATLATVAASEHRPLRVVVSDQTETASVFHAPVVASVVRFLRARGVDVETHRRLPRRGLAEHRQFLLDQVRAPACLFLDDDVLVEPSLVGRLVEALAAEGCGFVGSAVIGLSHVDDVRPHEQAVEWWDGPVRPERVVPGTPQWERHRLHSAANLWHLQRRLGLHPGNQRAYKVAWVGGCVLYDTAKLRAAGGYGFWVDLPADHCGEDVLAQLRVMERFGGCGLAPSGAYHQELATTVPRRDVDAPLVLR